MEYKPTAKDTATIVTHIEPTYVNVPFSTLTTNPATPQVAGESPHSPPCNSDLYTELALNTSPEKAVGTTALGHTNTAHKGVETIHPWGFSHQPSVRLPGLDPAQCALLISLS